MIYLKKLPFIDSLESMQEIASLDTLANQKKHLAVLGSRVPSHYRKADYAMVIHANFLTYPTRLYDALPAKEQKAVSKLLNMKADEYLTWPLKEDEELVMEDGRQWRLYMPDCIRRELDRGLKAEFMRMLNGGIPWLK